MVCETFELKQEIFSLNSVIDMDFESEFQTLHAQNSHNTKNHHLNI